MDIHTITKIRENSEYAEWYCFTCGYSKIVYKQPFRVVTVNEGEKVEHKSLLDVEAIFKGENQ